MQAANGSGVPSRRRTSSTGVPPRDDTVVQCILERVSKFQGYVSIDNIEELQVTSYQESQQFRLHYDWFGGKTTHERVSTFFGILDADCDNCGTSFPRISVNWTAHDQRWCQYVDCESESLVIRPIPGSAIFWRNVLPGTLVGDKRTAHEGLPLTRGFKTGVNIWTLVKIK